MKKALAKMLGIVGRPGGERVTVPFPVLFVRFQEILALNNRILELIAGANDTLGGDYVFDRHYIDTSCQQIMELTLTLTHNLDAMGPGKYQDLHKAFRRIKSDIDRDLAGRPHCPIVDFVLPYREIGRDAAETVGGKNASLAELRNFLDLRVPSGFAVTASSYHAFMEQNGLREQIDGLLTAWRQDRLSLAATSAAIRKAILASPLPAVVEKAIRGAVSRLREGGDKPLFLAVRSSGWGEDGERSFAGQFHTALQVPEERVGHAYREVVASAFRENALAYRREIGFDEEEFVMAVGCQRMVDAVASGVVYTLDPGNEQAGAMMIGATWGLGAPLVAGRAGADRFLIDRRPPYAILAVELVRKEAALIPAGERGAVMMAVEEERQTGSSLTDGQIRQLAEVGKLIENYFRKPQDIEFAFDQEGELIILQARPLGVRTATVPRAAELSRLLARFPVLLRNQGAVAQKGIASGPVYLLRDEARLDDCAAGVVLVARFASPLLARVIARVGAIITDIGSTTGHLATIAREFRVPCIVNTGNATALLADGQEVTVDAEENIVYQGRVEELRLYGLTEDFIEETAEYRLLRRVLKHIAPLNLLDPSAGNFSPAACRTLHDIVRFVHEKAVEELIERNYLHPRHDAVATVRLRWKIPLDLVLIDVGNGLRSGGRNDLVGPEAIVSLPMKFLLKGLAYPRAWDSEPLSVDLGSFMASLTRTISPELSSPRQVGMNLAVISENYANVSLRLGYHFTMIDSYVSENINDNYAYFRFFGGVTDATRRARRVRLLGEILGRHDFRIEVRGDLVVARVKKIDQNGMARRLLLLGQLVGFTRQLDVRLMTDRHIDAYIETFNQLYEVIP